MKQKQEIGIVTMNYNDEGEVTMASFKPTMSITIDKNLFERFSKIGDTGKRIKKESPSVHYEEDSEMLRENAELVFASWFNKTNEIELADREKYKIISETIRCSKHFNGRIAECNIRFSLAEL